MSTKGKNEWIPWALRRTNPDIFYFKDDGITPNSPLPVLIYRGLFDDQYENCETWLEEKFSRNGWVRTCSKPLFSCYHYHSNAHEVIGVCRGKGVMQLAADNGVRAEIGKGDVILIPAGVGHHCIRHSEDFFVIAGYAGNAAPDVKKALPEERTEALKNIKNVPAPPFDPILRDDEEGLLKFWN